jgi:hypothetical protein
MFRKFYAAQNIKKKKKKKRSCKILDDRKHTLFTRIGFPYSLIMLSPLIAFIVVKGDKIISQK